MSNAAINNYKAQLRFGNIMKAPGYYNRKVAIWDHNNFYKGWIQCGRSKEIFNKIRFANPKVEAELKGYISHPENGAEEIVCAVGFEELNMLESKGMKFSKSYLYQKIKCMELFRGLGN